MLGSVYLLQSVPLLEPLTEHLPDRVRLVGSCLHEPAAPDAQLVEWLHSRSDAPAPLYVQHGSVFRAGDTFWSGLLAACDELGIRLAASMERHRGAPPDSCDADRLVRGHVPQQPVLEQARGVVCSANTTAVLGALTHGLPVQKSAFSPCCTPGDKPYSSTRICIASCRAAASAQTVSIGSPAAPGSFCLSAYYRVCSGAFSSNTCRRPLPSSTVPAWW